MNIKKIFSAIVLTFFLTIPQLASAQNTVYTAHTQVELLSDVKSIAPGEPFWIVLRLQPDEGWHTYWQNPGDSGAAPSIKWELPEGFQGGVVQWTFPEKIEIAPLVSYGYPHENLLFIQILPAKELIRQPPLTAPPGRSSVIYKMKPASENASPTLSSAADAVHEQIEFESESEEGFSPASPTFSVLPSGERTVTFKAHVDWLTCKIECLPGQADFELSLPVRAQRPEMNSAWSLPFAQARSKVPRPSREWKVLVQDREEEYLLAINPLVPDLTINSVYFFPERDDLINHAAPQILQKTRQGYLLRVKKSKINTRFWPSLQGVLVASPGWHGENSFRALTVHAPVVQTVPRQQAKGVSSVKPQINLGLALLFALLGGIILNLMPCVLPVLSLKILNLTEHRKDKHSGSWKQGLFFTLGVLTAFWFLAGLLIILRGLGQQIGWGFQFQSPLFLIILIIVFFLFSLNLFGVFEIPAFIPQWSYLSLQKKGEGAAFASGLLATFVATPCTAPFMGTAIGFAITQPAWIAFLIFTFLGIGMALPFFILACFPQWLRFIPRPGSWMVRFKQFLGLLLLATVVWLTWVLVVEVGAGRAGTKTGQATEGKISWQKYSPELINQLHSQKRIVFVDFTAAWCLTCQVNERLTLNNSQVVQKFKELDIAALKADWTTHDSQITQALAALGKNSIPVYVLYGKETLEPVILPEIITPAIVLKALEKINKGV